MSLSQKTPEDFIDDLGKREGVLVSTSNYVDEICGTLRLLMIGVIGTDKQRATLSRICSQIGMHKNGYFPKASMEQRLKNEHSDLITMKEPDTSAQDRQSLHRFRTTALRQHVINTYNIQ